MIDRSRLGVAGVTGGVLMTLLTLVFLLTPRAHSWNVAPLGTYGLYADTVLDLAALGDLSPTTVTDPNSGALDTAATPEAGETLSVERRIFNSDPVINASGNGLSIQKRFNMSNAPGGAGLGNWTLVIGADTGSIPNLVLYNTPSHFCLALLAAIIGAEATNMTANTATLGTVDIRMRQGGYFAPVTDPPDTECDAPAS